MKNLLIQAINQELGKEYVEEVVLGNEIQEGLYKIFQGHKHIANIKLDDHYVYIHTYYRTPNINKQFEYSDPSFSVKKLIELIKKLVKEVI